jgi:hypothetical protein
MYQRVVKEENEKQKKTSESLRIKVYQKMFVLRYVSVRVRYCEGVSAWWAEVACWNPATLFDSCPCPSLSFLIPFCCQIEIKKMRVDDMLKNKIDTMPASADNFLLDPLG